TLTEQVIADRETLGADQADAVRTIAAGTAPVAVMIGPAGPGKTFTLDTIRTTYESAGLRVIGAAPSARASLELEAGAHIASRTLQSLIQQWDTGHDRPDRRTLLVIDEAGMADIRTLEHVVTRQLAAGGRVLLVGDHHQLPEVGAGGGFAHAATHAHTIAQLHINRRQRQPWEQAALTELRDGNVAHAVEQYLAHDRVIVAETPDGMIAAAVDRYLDARTAGFRPVLLAGTNELVDRLNVAVIDRLTTTGELDTDPPVTYGTGAFRIGERVVVRHNSSQHTTSGSRVDIANGQPGTVTHVDHDHVSVRLDTTGDDVVLGTGYLRQGGHITHGYALTAHRAQGGTWDLAISVGTDGLYREAGYVALSRGIHDNTLIITNTELAELHHQARSETERHDTGLDPTPPAEAADDLVDRVSRSRGKQLAHAIDPDLARVDALARSHTLPELEQQRRHCLTIEHAATQRHGATGEQLTQRIANTHHIARHISIGAHVSPYDRHNVGVVTALDDTRGSATIRFTSADGRQAQRTFTWDRLRIVDPNPIERPTTDTITAATADLVAPIQHALDEWTADLHAAGITPGDAKRYTLAAAHLVERETAALIAAAPSWLEQLVGQRPFDVAGATTWTNTVTDLTSYRLQHNLDPATPGIGERPADGAAAAGWDAVSTTIGRARVWLATSDRLAPTWPSIPSRRELHQRRAELDQLFDTAPDDCRALITKLQTGDLDLNDTSELLADAVAQQDQRQQWIIRNWPHVVEYQEINRTLATTTWGPDPNLLNVIDDHVLRQAIDRGEPWIRAALCAIAH
ncbi:MAG: AAA family ATPase, partial [Actinomycetota bacterium]